MISVTRPIGRFALVLALALSPALMAQQAPEGTSPGAESQGDGGAMADARNRMQELQEELEQVRDQALERQPELREQQADLQQRITERLRAEGVDPEADLQRLQEIANEIRGGGIDDQRQQELAEEYQQKRTALLEARRAALQDQSIQEDTEEFRSALLTAMRAEDENVDGLISDLTEAQQTLRREMQGDGMGGQGQ